MEQNRSQSTCRPVENAKSGCRVVRRDGIIIREDIISPQAACCSRGAEYEGGAPLRKHLRNAGIHQEGAAAWG